MPGKGLQKTTVSQAARVEKLSESSLSEKILEQFLFVVLHGSCHRCP